MASSPTVTATGMDGCSTATWDSVTQFLDCVVDGASTSDVVAEGTSVVLVVSDVTTPSESAESVLGVRTYVTGQADFVHDFEDATGPVTSLQGLYSDYEGVFVPSYSEVDRAWNKGGWDYSGGDFGTQPVEYATTSNTNPNNGGTNLFRSDYSGTTNVGATAIGEYRTGIFDLGIGAITAEYSGSGTVSIGLYEIGLPAARLLKSDSPPSDDAALAQMAWSESDLAAFVGKSVFIKIIDNDAAGFIAVDNLQYPALWKIDEGEAEIPSTPAGRLLSYPRWDTAVDKPGTDTSVTVSFRTNGGVPSGGAIVMKLPDDYSAVYVSGAPPITFSEPSGTTGSAIRMGGSSNWKVVPDQAVPEDTVVSFTLSGIHTPDVARAASQGEIYTQMADGGRIDFRTLFVDRLDNGKTQLMSGAQYGAYCPNSCSRHGTCRNFGRCTCYTRPGSDDPAWTENDCSLRTCPKGDSWSDLASANSVAHGRTECSMAGMCNRKTGECECFEGYEGKACERSLCPNNCNNRGRCVTQEILAYEASKTYSAPWDAQKEAGCVCDLGARGPDCSLEECPTGKDARLGLVNNRANNWGRDCSGRGICDFSSGLCHCFSGFFGFSCSEKAEFG